MSSAREPRAGTPTGALSLFASPGASPEVSGSSLRPTRSSSATGREFNEANLTPLPVDLSAAQGLPAGAGKVVWAEIGLRRFFGTGEGLNLSDFARAQGPPDLLPAKEVPHQGASPESRRSSAVLFNKPARSQGAVFGSALVFPPAPGLDEFATSSGYCCEERPRSNGEPLLPLSFEALHRKRGGMADGSVFSLVFSRALGKVVVHVHGALDADTAPALKARMVDIIDDQGNRQVVLDLRKTTGVDAAGLLVLADALKRMEDYGGELLLSGPTSAVEKKLRAVGLEETLDFTPEWTHPAGGGIGASRRRKPGGAR